eukprot:TRINITY_DN5035_c0_g1_i1.p1 TRINITY_DN5035_c0_g1~~TRINITY_DN5035_c0_g1_i1.p1  ORF type:complete len:484 (+),score=111.18 TRINITY_DN5035_c0_g1_i1:97-1548(+)
MVLPLMGLHPSLVAASRSSVSSQRRQTQRAARSSFCRCIVVAVAVCHMLSSAFVGRRLSAFVGNRWRALSLIPRPNKATASPRVSRAAAGEVLEDEIDVDEDEDDEDFLDDVPSMEEADVFETEAHPESGELMMPGLPGDTGVYAVFDAYGMMQYVGISKHIDKAIGGHANVIGAPEVYELIATVRCLPMPGADMEFMKAVWERWLRDYIQAGGAVPPGNLPEGSEGSDDRWRNKAGQRAPLDLSGVRGINNEEDALDAVKNAVAVHPVVLFMKGTPASPRCGFSARSAGILNRVGVPYDTVNVMDDEANPGVREAVKKFGSFPTIPQMYIKGELVGGADIITDLFEAGELKAMMKAAVNGESAANGQTEEQATEEQVDFQGEIAVIEDASRPVATLMSRTLAENLQLSALRIVDESAAHAAHEGGSPDGESHFQLEIVSSDFDGMTPVRRQQKVFQVLEAVMPRVHALSLVLRTPKEMLASS